MTTRTIDESDVTRRPWGSYTVLDDTAPDFKVKLIVVAPGQRLSYQRHAKRAEHWLIVSGKATVVREGETFHLDPGASIDIAIGQAHRCENHGEVPVRFVEVQTGSYFGEDDIVRLEDDYGRVASS